MFGMFDVTRNGKVSGRQVTTALKSIKGPDAEITVKGFDKNVYYDMDEFVSFIKPQLA